jgi:hypothetical protein
MLSKALCAISVSYLAVFFRVPDCAYEEIKLCHHIFGASDVIVTTSAASSQSQTINMQILMTNRDLQIVPTSTFATYSSFFILLYVKMYDTSNYIDNLSNNMEYYYF